MTTDGYYFSLKKYPNLKIGNTNSGFIKIGDGDGNDELKFSKVYLKTTTGLEQNNVAVKSDVLMTYDFERGCYTATLSSDDFLFKYDKVKKTFKASNNGTLYFQGADVNDKLLDDYIWIDDKMDKNTPSSFSDADYLSKISAGSLSATSELPKYQGAENYIGNYTICFKLVGQDADTPTYCYWVETAGNSVEVPYFYDRYIRSFCNYKAVDIDQDAEAENDLTKDYTKIYMVDGFTAADENLPSGTEQAATAHLTPINFIPAGTNGIGVMLVSRKGTSNLSPSSIPVSVKFKDHTDDYHESSYTGNKNFLIGTLVDKTINASVFNNAGNRTDRNFFFSQRAYCNDYKSDGNYIGFFRAMKGSTSVASKAYLKVPVSICDYYIKNSKLDFSTASGAKGISLIFGEDGDITSGVTEVKVEDSSIDDAYYTLTGIKVSNPSKGIYIHGGKTIYIK